MEANKTLSQSVADIMGCEVSDVDSHINQLLFGQLITQGYTPTAVDLLKAKHFIKKTELNPLEGTMYAIRDDFGGGINLCLKIDGWLTIGRRVGMVGVETKYSEDHKTYPGMYDGVFGHVWIEVTVKFADHSEVTHREFLAENLLTSLAWLAMPNRTLRYRCIAQCVRFKTGIYEASDYVGEPLVSKTNATVQVDKVVDAPASAPTKVEVPAEVVDAPAPAPTKAEVPAEVVEAQAPAKADVPARAKKGQQSAELEQAHIEPKSEVVKFDGDPMLLIDTLIGEAPEEAKLTHQDVGAIRTILTRSYESGQWVQVEKYIQGKADNIKATPADKFLLKVFLEFKSKVRGAVNAAA